MKGRQKSFRCPYFFRKACGVQNVLYGKQIGVMDAPCVTGRIGKAEEGVFSR